jgi:hypothetical protein
MSRVSVLQDFENVDRPGFKREGIGSSVQELAVSDAFYPELRNYLGANLKAVPFVEADFSISVNRGEIVITGFERSATTAAFPSSKTGTNG